MARASRISTSYAPAVARVRVGRDGVEDVLAGGPLAVRRLRDEGDGVVRLGVVQRQAMLVDGDDVRLDLRLDPGARAIVQDVSGTLAHPMRSGASWQLTVAVAEDARLALLEAPLVAAEGADLVRSLHCTLAESARLLHRETLVLGRHGERPGRIRTRTRVVRAGRPQLDDALDSGLPRSPAVLGAARVVASLALFGHQVEPAGFVLGPDAQLVRRLAARASELAELDRLEARWTRAALTD